ncbi:MAG: TetR/AcrR family transcriptional regulator [Candidatus Zixiibacteriota bacterium]
MLDENVITDLVRRRVISDTFRRLTPEKKLQVYQAAIRLFGEYGYDGLAVDRICHEAGISKGSFFQYFESKSHLLEFAILVFDNYLSKLVAELRQNEKAALAKDRFRSLYESLVVNARLTESEQKFFLFVTHALDHAGVVLEGIDLERHHHQWVLDIITRGVRTGEIRGDFDVELTEYLVSALIEALLRRQYSGRAVPDRRTEEYLISFLFDGIKG